MQEQYIGMYFVAFNGTIVYNLDFYSHFEQARKTALYNAKLSDDVTTVEILRLNSDETFRVVAKFYMFK